VLTTQHLLPAKFGTNFDKVRSLGRYIVCLLTKAMEVFFFYYYSEWGKTESLGSVATTGLLYRPQMIGDGDCGEIGGIKIGRGNRSTRRKPSPAPLCPLQIPHE
jgi:hypothetical protein